MKFHCPHCNQRIEYDYILAGQIGACPRCKIEIKLPKLPVPIVKEEETPSPPPPVKAPVPATIEKPAHQQTSSMVRMYHGHPSSAKEQYVRKANRLMKEGWMVTSEQWVDGQWGCTAFIVAILLLPVFGIGIFVFLYLLIVKPNNGYFTVTYERKVKDTAICPMCAEEIKRAARVCKHCNHHL